MEPEPDRVQEPDRGQIQGLVQDLVLEQEQAMALVLDLVPQPDR